MTFLAEHVTHNGEPVWQSAAQLFALTHDAPYAVTRIPNLPERPAESTAGIAKQVKKHTLTGLGRATGVLHGVARHRYAILPDGVVHFLQSPDDYQEYNEIVTDSVGGMFDGGGE